MSKLTRRALLVTGGLATLGFAPTAARTLGTELLIRKGKDWGLCNEEEDNQNAADDNQNLDGMGEDDEAMADEGDAVMSGADAGFTE